MAVCGKTARTDITGAWPWRHGHSTQKKSDGKLVVQLETLGVLGTANVNYQLRDSVLTGQPDDAIKWRQDDRPADIKIAIEGTLPKSVKVTDLKPQMGLCGRSW